MKRPLCVIGITFAITTWAALFFAPGAKQALLFSGALALTGVLFLLLSREKEKLRVITLLFLSGAVGAASVSLYLSRSVEPFLQWEGEEITVEGVITQVRRGSGKGVRYTIEASYPGTNLPDSAFVLWEYGEEGAWEEGQGIRFTAVFRQPSYEGTADYYRKSGIPGEAYLREPAEEIPLTGKFAVIGGMARLRGTLRDNLYRLLPQRSAGLVAAMTLGLTEDISPQLYTALNVSGTSHLVSVSGLHLSIFTGLILSLLRRMGLSRRKSAVGGILAALAFTLLVGASPSILRSFAMTGIMLLGAMLGRKSDSLSSLGLAALVIAALRPHWMLSMGTWLSFGATAGIILLAKPITEWLEKRFLRKEGKRYDKLVRALAGILGTTMGAYVFTLPILVVGTGYISLLAPLGNILVAPFVSVVVGGGLLCAALPSWLPVKALAVVVDVSARMIAEISQVLAKLPFAIFSLDESYLLFCLLAAVAVVLAGLRLSQGGGKRVAVCCLAGIVLLFGSGSLVHRAASGGRVELVLLEDCGTVILLRNGRAVLLGSPDRYEADDLAAYLRFRNIREIDLLAASGGMPSATAVERMGEIGAIRSAVGPDDALLLEEMAELLPGVPVYASGYASVRVLERVELVFEKDGEILVRIGGRQVMAYSRDYDSPEEYVIMGKDSEAFPAWEPVGGAVYGETRYYF
ncbi:MAG: ComEC/Rec2 family competence protein [Oscillospiraceae bacterium]